MVLLLVDNEINVIPEVKKIYDGSLEVKQIYAQFPFISAVPSCFNLKEYNELKKHETGFIAKKLGISFQEEKVAIKKLLEFGLIELKKEKYVDLASEINTDLKFSKHTPQRYWIYRTLKIFDENELQPSESYFTYLVSPVTEEERQKIQKKIHKFFYELNREIEVGQKKKNKDKVIVMSVNVFNPEYSKKK